jgi:mono/diheme cytochrome c family protein
MIGFSCFLLLACSRGRSTKKTPVHPNPNMDKMEKFTAQDKSPFFEDGRTMRQPVSGTVARGWLLEDSDTDIYVERYNYTVPVDQAFTYYTGGVGEGKTEIVNNKKQLVFTDKSPIPATVEFLYRGKDRFEIYCSACHGYAGEGNGIITKFSQMKPKNLHEVRDYKIGNIYDVLSNGRNTMKGYRHQIPVEDRWAIAAYVKALQETRNQTKK